jgi:uncharacterized protein YcbK (DUF882 family)
MKGPSPHLTWGELGCKDGTPYPEKWRATRALHLAEEFERIRQVFGNNPITIGSAYRTETYNRKVGGARNSQHVEGRALDLYPPKGWSLEKFTAGILEIARSPKSRIYGVGKYPTFVHVDIRPAPAADRLTVWQGNRAWAELKEK